MAGDHVARLRRTWAAALLALISVIACPAVLTAQRLTGTVIDRGVRVPGAVVMLLGADGSVVARTVTREGGEFSLAATTAGSYTVRVLRIGYQPTVAGPYTLGAGATLTADVRVTGRIVVLPQVDVNDRSECRVRPDSTAVAFQLWDMARTALMAAALTQSRSYGVRITRSDRMLDRDATRVLTDSTWTREGMSSNPITSLPPDSLAKIGYVTRDDAGGTTYWGPDANVLLADSFAAGHCIRTQRPVADTGVLQGVVGVAFEPVKRTDKVDISGVLWLDRQTAELRTLDYRYANVAPIVERGNAGGHIEFLRLPDGSWTVSRWMIRYPVLLTRQEVDHLAAIPGMSNLRTSQEVNSVRESSGELLQLKRSGDVWWERGKVSATIRVVDSVTGGAVRGALVSIDGGHSANATAADGTIRFDRVLPGPVSVIIRIPTLDSLGVAPIHVPVTIPDHPFDPIVTRLASPTTQFAARCGERALDWSEGAVRGLLPSGQAGRLVEATWQEPFTRLGGGAPVLLPQARRVTADSTGGFLLCGVPREIPITLRVLGTTDQSLVRVVQVGQRSLATIADFSR